MPVITYMMRQLVLSLTGLSALFLVSATALGAGLVMQIVTPHGDDRILYRDATSHFHVVLINTSSKPIRLWHGSNSWGHYALSFHLTHNGQTAEIKKPPTIFTVNFPRAFTIAPRGAHVIDVYFGDPLAWEGFEILQGEASEIKLCADFHVEATKESRELEVWTGRVRSKCRDLLMYGNPTAKPRGTEP